ncbi:MULTISPECIES: AAA family ATPase [unclassified Mameliella]|uniref:AAA family ATPase n=1 Tax=unclassified Mameliella TaxID=2630630 RepID=UPI00273D49AF|nr:MULTISPECIES: AAA family ATPase [unclassified Mameliella]
MRFVERSSTSTPNALVSEDVRQAVRDVHRYLNRPQDERGQRRSPFEESLVFNDAVRKALGGLFFEKCAYCETKVSLSEAGIDHFRPIRVSEERQTDYGHYAWLTYDWENLYLVCPACNSQKGARFPVDGQRGSPFATVNEMRLSERPALLDPCYDNPRLHIQLRPDGSYVPRSGRGRATIDLFDLNRDDLVRDRHEEIEHLNRVFRNGVDRLELEAAISQDAPYSGAKVQYVALIIEVVTGRRPNWSRHGPVFGGVLASMQNVEAITLNTAIERLLNKEDSAETAFVPQRFSDQPTERRALRDADFTAEPARQTLIREIKISNFKGIDALTLKVPALRPGKGSSGALMLLGENAVGKTTVLEAIALSLLGELDADGMVRPEDLLRRKGRDRQELIEPDIATVELSFYDRSSPAVLSIDPLRRQFEGDRSAGAVVIAYGPRRFSDVRTKWHHNRSARVESLFRPAVPLADPTSWLRDIARDDEFRFKAVTRGLREILALRDGDELVLDEAMGICVSVRGHLEPVSRLSEGYRSLFAMAVDIMRELLRTQPDLEDARGVVLIDEIETHLHPRWKMRVTRALRKAMPKVTFIATTHDPLCLRGMEQGEVVVLAKDRNQQIYQLTDLPDISGMRVEQILTSDYFGLNSTADPETEAQLTAYVATLSRAQAGDQDAEERATRLGATLRETLVLGETAADQLAQEALDRFLAERHDLSSVERSDARLEVVDAMLRALRQPLEE